MGIVLKVTPETLLSMSDNIEKQINDLQKQFRAIHTDIGRTQSFWEGEASNRHKSQYDELKDDIDEAIKHLKDHPVNLLRMADLYKTTETQVKLTAQALSADVIV